MDGDGGDCSRVAWMVMGETGLAGRLDDVVLVDENIDDALCVVGRPHNTTLAS